jgi:hypothetical protein
MYAINHVPYYDLDKSSTGCCNLINPEDWDEREFTFERKPFVRVSTKSLLHIPINMNKVMTRAQKAIVDAGVEAEEQLVLSYEVSPWRADHYIAVSHPVQGMINVPITGKFIAKVFEGPYKEIRNWYNQLQKYVESLGKEPLKTYFFYTACPKCAKAYGKNYVVGFEKVT